MKPINIIRSPSISHDTDQYGSKFITSVRNSPVSFETCEYRSKPINIARDPSISFETHQYHPKPISIIRNYERQLLFNPTWSFFKLQIKISWNLRHSHACFKSIRNRKKGLLCMLNWAIKINDQNQRTSLWHLPY